MSVCRFLLNTSISLRFASAILIILELSPTHSVLIDDRQVRTTDFVYLLNFFVC